MCTVLKPSVFDIRWQIRRLTRTTTKPRSKEIGRDKDLELTFDVALFHGGHVCLRQTFACVTYIGNMLCLCPDFLTIITHTDRFQGSHEFDIASYVNTKERFGRWTMTVRVTSGVVASIAVSHGRHWFKLFCARPKLAFE